MLGLIALIAAILIGSLAVVGVLGDAATSSRVGAPGDRAAEEAARPEPSMRVLDESVSAGKLNWTLRGDFLVLTFAVENDSGGPVTLTEDSIALVDENGFEGHPAASVNSEYVDPAKAILFNERGLLDPGENREGKVNFDLAAPFGVEPTADLSGFRIQLGDGDPAAEEGERLDLEL